MIKACLTTLTLLAASSSLALAEPNRQLVLSIEQRLAGYGLAVDVSAFATSTVAELHLTLSSPEGYWKTRRELRNILRKAKYK